METSPPADDQDTFGLEYTRPASGYDFELGMMSSSGDEDLPSGGDFEVSTLELYGGIRHVFGRSGDPFRPYLAGGISALKVDRDAPGADDDELDVGSTGGSARTSRLVTTCGSGWTCAGSRRNPFDFGDIDNRLRPGRGDARVRLLGS